MLKLEVLKKILLFLFGIPHNTMYAAITFAGVNVILDFFRKYEPPKTAKTIFRDMFKRLLAYVAFLILATRVDDLAVNQMLGWDGSTQFLVCLYIAAREIKIILDYIRSQGIEIPGVLDSRINQMVSHGQDRTEGIEGNGAAYVTAENLDQRIQELKKQLDDIEQQNNNGGGNA